MFDLHFKVMSIEQTVDHILETGCSISRFGDGEIALMNHFSIPFQKSNKQLARELRKVYMSKDDRLLVCVPEPLMSVANLKPESQDWWKHELNPMRRLFWKKGIRDWSYVYGNAFLTRPYMSYADKSHSAYVFGRIKQLWQERNIVMIEGQKSRVGIGNDLFSNAKSVKRILGPSVNAYSSMDNIINYVKDNIRRDSLVLLALGPAATVMAYCLSEIGYQALDVGHLDIEYEWYRIGTLEKIPVKNKYTNEVPEGRNVLDVLDNSYLGQIISDFSN